ncbi:MAG: uracil-DNA glycosylase [Clostridiales bacterium]|nr:uracil-DNA glycosylase [Clostridiales bacterium]MCF8023424.1 uracil-DNA glycosylase [Clostridiales bacterium]
MERIQKLYAELENCNIDCPLNSTSPIVKGYCPGKVNIAFVGEAPGAKEAKLGTPFIGTAGSNFSEFLNYLNLNRDEVFITNTVKCRPTVNYLGEKNRAPKTSEISACFYYLEKELDIINPEVIVTLGNIPLRQLSGDKKASISNYHGKMFSYKKSKVFPTYHPGALTYNPGLKDIIKGDLDLLKKLIIQ